MKSSWFAPGFLLVALLLASAGAFGAGTSAGTVIQNSASVAYSDSGGNPQPSVQSNVANVTVSQVAAVAVAPTTASKQASPGSTATYALTATNNGNGADNFSLSAVSASSPAWTVTLFRDDGANGGTANDGIRQSGETNPATSTGSLAADASFRCFAVVQVPTGAADASRDTTTFTATSQFDATKKASAVLTTTVSSAVLTLTKSADQTSAAPGANIQYTITYRNGGSGAAQNVVITDAIPAQVNYVANSVTLNASPKTDAADSDEVTVSSSTITITLGNLAAGAQGTITFRVQVK